MAVSVDVLSSCLNQICAWIQAELAQETLLHVNIRFAHPKPLPSWIAHATNKKRDVREVLLSASV